MRETKEKKDVIKAKELSVPESEKIWCSSHSLEYLRHLHLQHRQGFGHVLS